MGWPFRNSACPTASNDRTLQMASQEFQNSVVISTIAGVLQHADFLSAFDLPADFGLKTETGKRLSSMDQERFVSIRIPSCVSAIRSLSVPRAGQQADIRHSNDRQAVPAFRAHRSGRAVQAHQMRRSRFERYPRNFPFLMISVHCAGTPSSSVSKGAESLPVVEPASATTFTMPKRIAAGSTGRASENSCRRKFAS